MRDCEWPAFEPYKTKMVEAIPITTASQRRAAAERAKYNLFKLRAREVTIDLLTDSGTAAMSDRQWSRIMLGDESYAGAESFLVFQDTVRRITGMQQVLPTHQGRAAENLLFTAMVKPGDIVPNNMHFDTTEANVITKGGQALNLPCGEASDITADKPFKGNMDTERLEQVLTEHKGEVPLVIMTVTNNSAGGQPASMANVREVSRICHRHKVPLFLDCARYAENCWFIKHREPGYHDKSVEDIAHEMFGHADGALMSAKKDAYVNIGGFLAMRNHELKMKVAEYMVVVEGFVTYGGMAGRDMEAVAQGLQEGLDEQILTARIGQVTRLADRLTELGIPTLQPAGGHAVFLDVKRMLPHIPQSQLPGQALTVELYLEGGVRSVEIGTVMFAHADPETGEMLYPDLELVRLAIPRRVYSDNHMEHVARTCRCVLDRAEKIRGMRFTYSPPRLKHFLAHFDWVQ
ncbi:MAG: tryptophanase [Candidatus Lernaella stagnicola]|nr:tryptophanase [Candidatus Lernaella stagnicola]